MLFGIASARHEGRPIGTANTLDFVLSNPRSINEGASPTSIAAVVNAEFETVTEDLGVLSRLGLVAISDPRLNRYSLVALTVVHQD